MSRYCIVVLCLLLSACASTVFDAGKTETVLRLSKAWVDGRQVEYVVTDVSDLKMAQAIGVNYVPRLTHALARTGNRSLLERVYKFSQNEQISVFQSGPQPTGPLNADSSYSPLWRLVLVHRLTPGGLREMTSEEDILAAEERGEVRLEVTDIVINCPITRGADGKGLLGVR